MGTPSQHRRRHGVDDAVLDGAATTTALLGIFIVNCSHTKSRSRMMEGNLNVPRKMACRSTPKGLVASALALGTSSNAVIAGDIALAVAATAFAVAVDASLDARVLLSADLSNRSKSSPNFGHRFSQEFFDPGPLVRSSVAAFDEFEFEDDDSPSMLSYNRNDSTSPPLNMSSNIPKCLSIRRLKNQTPRPRSRASPSPPAPDARAWTRPRTRLYTRPRSRRWLCATVAVERGEGAKQFLNDAHIGRVQRRAVRRTVPR